MKTERVWKMYWSATGTTKTVVSAIADRLAAELGLAVETYDFTLPAARRTAPEFAAGDVVVFGTPTYAGRVPNGKGRRRGGNSGRDIRQPRV